MTKSEQIRERILKEAKEAGLELTEREQEYLDRACSVSDQIDLIQATLDRDGLTVAGPGGIVRSHPLLAEVRALTSLLHRLLASIQLDPRKVNETPSEQGRRAANARWRGRGMPVQPPERRASTSAPRKTPIPEAV
jgi:hypothetical protein